MTLHERPEIIRAVAMRINGFSYRDIELQTGVGKLTVKIRVNPIYKEILRQYAFRNEWRRKCLAGEGDPNCHYKAVRTYPYKSLSPEINVVALPRLKCLERQ